MPGLGAAVLGAPGAGGAEAGWVLELWGLMPLSGMRWLFFYRWPGLYSLVVGLGLLSARQVLGGYGPWVALPERATKGQDWGQADRQSWFRKAIWQPRTHQRSRELPAYLPTCLPPHNKES